MGVSTANNTFNVFNLAAVEGCKKLQLAALQVQTPKH